MKPGREMDALIHQRVFGLCVHVWETEETDHFVGERKHTCAECGDVKETTYPMLGPRSHLAPYYSTSIAAALQVLEKMDSCQVEKNPHYADRHGGLWFVSVTTYNPERYGEAYADTLPHAISLAALQAFGVQIPASTAQDMTWSDTNVRDHPSSDSLEYAGLLRAAAKWCSDNVHRIPVQVKTRAPGEMPSLLEHLAEFVESGELFAENDLSNIGRRSAVGWTWPGWEDASTVEVTFGHVYKGADERVVIVSADDSTEARVMRGVERAARGEGIEIDPDDLPTDVEGES